jgi:hypothetical protein
MHTSPYIPASENVFKKIKETGVVPEEILELLKIPKSAFVSESRIIAGDDMLSVINSNFFESVFLMRKKTPGLFNFLNRLCSAGKKTAKFFITRKGSKKDGGIKHYN